MKFPRYTAFILPCFIAFCTLPAKAQTTRPDTITATILPLTLQNLQPAEVRALRAGSESPFAKTDISGKEIRDRNLGQDLPFLLQYTPSAVVTSDAGAGVGYTSLRIRGTDGTRINVTLNGVTVNDAESQGTYFVDLPDIASSVSSIQIQRGVGTSTNGAGAFGGTVSISNLEQMATAGAEARFSYGSFNTQKYTVHAGTGLTKNHFAMDIRLSGITSAGYIERSASDLKSLQLQASWTPSERTALRFMMLQGQEITHQAWNGVPQDSLANNRRYNELGQKSDGSFYDNQVDHYRQNYYQLFADRKFRSRLTAHAGLFLTRGIGYYEEYKTGQAFADYGLPNFTTPANDTLETTDLIRQLWLDNYYYGTVFSLLYDDGPTKLTFGGNWSQYAGNHYGLINWAQYGVPDHYRYYKLDAQKNDANLYAKAERRIGSRLILFGDIQWRNVAYFMNGFRYNPDLRPAVEYNFFNPKAGFTWLLRNKALSQQKIYASLAAANHEPNRADFEAALSSLPKPERLYDLEAGYSISRKKWSAGANIYYMDYKDQLVLTGKINDVGAYSRVNVPQSYRAGLELEAEWKPLSYLTLQGNATFSRNKIKEFTEYLDNYDVDTQTIVVHSNSDIAFSPNTIASGSILLQPFSCYYGKGLSLELIGKFVDRQYLDNSGNSALTGNDHRYIRSYGLCDMRIRYALPLRPFRELDFTLAVNNLLDNKYESNGYTFSYIYDKMPITQNYYYPQAGINWMVGLGVKW